jgi:hypothetical protein
LGPIRGTHFFDARHPGRTHLGAGDFLDLAGGTGSVIDLDALTQSQIDDVLLARHVLRQGDEVPMRPAPVRQIKPLSSNEPMKA